MSVLRRILLTLVSGCAVFAAGGTASAQADDPTVDVQLVYPAPGVSNFFSVESGDVNRHLGFNGGLMLNFAHKPLSVQVVSAGQPSQEAGAVIANRIDFTFFAAFGLFDIADIGVTFPLVAQGGFEVNAFNSVGIDLGTQQIAGFTPGDLHVVPKIRFLQLSEGTLSMAIVPVVVIPTSKSPFAGEKFITPIPMLAISTHPGAFHLSLNAGYKLRLKGTTIADTFKVDDEIVYKLGAGITFDLGGGSPLEVIGEVHGATPADNPWGIKSKGDERQFQRVRSPLELDVGLRSTVADMLKIGLAGGTGLMPGYGAPLFRVFATVAYFTADSGPADEDKDGVPDETDKCAKRKEDMDGFQDDDGCPDLDNDRDNVLDEDDQCPLEAEDRDGFEDEDGCPEADNDKDGVLDKADSCPQEAEDKDGNADEDGCPELDDDSDGIADAVDKCAREAEDKDNFEDFDGCPEPDNDADGMADLNDLCPNNAEDKDGVADDDGCPEDNDGDGILDADDKCPMKAEVYNGIDDEDGCPEALKAKSLVNVTDEKIEIKETILFKTNSAEIDKKSFNLLDQVASVLKNYKHIAKVRVEGHTDNVGNKKRNTKLSQERADSVRAYLVGKGIDPSRLESAGFGPDKAIASNKTKRGREQNRRVEFIIVELKALGKDVSEGQAKPADAPPADGGGIEMNLDLPDIGGGAAPAPAPEEKKPADPAPAGGEVEFNF